MKHYKLIISSKNRSSLYLFIKLFYKKVEKFSVLRKYFATNSRRKIFTILKSPHVNKVGQEQFQTNTYSKTLNFSVSESLKFLVLLKVIKTNLFLDVKLKLKLNSNSNFTSKEDLILYNPFNFNMLQKSCSSFFLSHLFSLK